MMFMVSYKPLPGKAAEAIRLREDWMEKYAQKFREHVTILQDLVDPCDLSGYLLIEAGSEAELTQLGVLQRFFGSAVQFELHTVVDVSKGIAKGAQEPSRLL